MQETAAAFSGILQPAGFQTDTEVPSGQPCLPPDRGRDSMHSRPGDDGGVEEAVMSSVISRKHGTEEAERIMGIFGGRKKKEEKKNQEYFGTF